MKKREMAGFTRLELVCAVATVAVIWMLLIPGMNRRWNAAGLDQSLNNVRQVLSACGAYRADNLDRVPMRGAAYQNGTISGSWDTWHFAGKNNNIYWASQGAFDESAYARPLNPYLYNRPIAVPTGYINTGSGSTWTFNHGFVSTALRNAVQIPVLRSPGDRGTRQRIWPTLTPTITAYDDVGTSYFLNFKWWDQPGWPQNFTPRFNAGSEAIRRVLPNQEPVRPFVWIHDQTADVVHASSPNFVIKGEFGGVNKSVMGFLTGDADYLAVIPRALSGGDYTFGLRVQ